jgi:hypothetical protein
MRGGTSAPAAISRRTSREIAFITAALAVGLIGVGLILSAPFDAQARSSLGSALITGMVVGLALAAIEYTVETRREAAQDMREARQSDGMLEVAKSRLSDLIAAHIWTYWWLLLEARNDAQFLLPARPDRYNDDVARVHAILQWFREKSGAEPQWWKDPTLLASIDLVSYITFDLLERSAGGQTINTEEQQGESVQTEADRAAAEELLHEERQRVVDRLAGVAQRFAEMGNVPRAFALDGQVEAFVRGKMPTYAPPPGDTVPDNPYLKELRWLVDQLRDDAIAVNEYGQPVHSPVPDPYAYRWGLLCESTGHAKSLWEQRYDANSWLQRLSVQARTELRARFLEPSQQQGGRGQVDG